MTVGPSLTAGGEAAWLRMKQHLEWCDEFALVFLFSDQPAVTRVLRERLAAIYRARVTGLEVPVPESPDALLEGLLPRLLQPRSYQAALQAPLWLDLTRRPAGQDGRAASGWQQARLEFLARLNEQREPLRRALARPLVLVLPLTEKARIRALVPDLWAVRRFSLDLGHWLDASPEPSPAPPLTLRAAERREPFPLDATEQALVAEWHRLRAKGRGDRGDLVAGGRAFDALTRRGHVDEARGVAEWLVEVARRRLGARPDDAVPLRDLSVSLDNVGQIDRALGALEAARAAFGEGLEIAQRLAAALPNHADHSDMVAWFEERLRQAG